MVTLRPGLRISALGCPKTSAKNHVISGFFSKDLLPFAQGFKKDLGKLEFRGRNFVRARRLLLEVLRCNMVDRAYIGREAGRSDVLGEMGWIDFQKSAKNDSGASPADSLNAASNLRPGNWGLLQARC